MNTRKRHRPSQAGNNPSAVQAFSVKDLFTDFRNDEACLTRIMEIRHGLRHVCRKCGKDSTFHRLAVTRAFACSHCGDHVHPTAGTILQDSRTSLQSWLYCMYLFIATRHGVSGKEIQRTLGVTYKTAWRMGTQIRDLMDKSNDFEMLKGHIEADEGFVGGRRSGQRGRGAAGKTIVLGIKQRGGRLNTEVIKDTKKATLRGIVNETVEKGSIVSTDEYESYNLLRGDGYQHGAVDHGRKEYPWTDRVTGTTHHVNHVKSFWKLFKDSINSTHIHISQKHMDRYSGEFEFRSNRRQMKNAMFDLLIAAL
jgi:transposase-like protein